MKQVSS